MPTPPQSTTLFVRDMTVYGIFGVHDYELLEPQECCISVSATSTLPPVANDALTETVNYGMFVSIAKDVVENGRHALVETIAETIAQRILALPHILHVEVDVAKPKPFAPAHVGVRITRSRSLDM
jgi:dihydroneopterin aldolase